VNLNQLLGGTELQDHICDPVEGSRQQRIGGREHNENTGFRVSDPIGRVNGCNLKPSTDNLSRQQNVGKRLKTSLHYSHSVTHQPSADERNQAGIEKYPQMKHHRSGFRQQQRDSHSPQVYNTSMQGNIHMQNFDDMVSISFSGFFCLLCTVLSRLYCNGVDSLIWSWCIIIYDYWSMLLSVEVWKDTYGIKKLILLKSVEILSISSLHKLHEHCSGWQNFYHRRQQSFSQNV